MENLADELHDQMSRRTFLGRTSAGIGSMALAALLNPASAAGFLTNDENRPSGNPHFAPKAKRIIYLFQSGAPSQLETFDYKPKLETMWGQNLPESVRNGQRLTGMSAGQSNFPLAASTFKFAQYGKSRMWVSELLPRTAQIVDELCFVRSMHTEAINHDPAVTFFQTGSQQAGRPSFGSWISYGLGSEIRICQRLWYCSPKAETAISRSTRSCGAMVLCPPCIRASYFGLDSTRFIT